MYRAMRIDIEQLPEWVKLEVSKGDLLAFAEKLQKISEKEEQPEEATEKDELFNFEEMCRFLGIAKSTGYQRIGRGEIPHFKKGRRLYFWKLELVKWVESGRRKTKEDLGKIAEKYLADYKIRQKRG